MVFVPEDGSGLSNSNAYVTVAAYKAYQADRGAVITSSDTQLQENIVLASDYLDMRWVFIGDRTLNSQAMEWPRVNAFYEDGRIASGVPVEVEESCHEYTTRSLAGELAPDPTYDASNATVTSFDQRVGSIKDSKTFGNSGTTTTFRKYPSADRRLRELVINGRFLERA